MGFFTSDQVEAMSATTVRVGTLVELACDDVQRVWNGFGDLSAGGYTWKGVGTLGKIEGLAGSRGTESRQVTMTVSGAPAEMLALAIGDTDAVQGKIATVFLQLFDDTWQTIGDPYAIYFGVMQAPKIDFQPAQGVDGAVCTVMLPVENLFFGRARPAAGRYTDRDQQTRFPGDRFFERAPTLVGRPAIWPNY